jgi:very-short-patch-repair endonuclease
VDGPATSKRRTLLDCLRRLPFDEALAVADSALRHADSTSAELHRLAADARGPGAKQLRRVVAHASAKARNPFESVLRAIAIEAGLDVEPQVKIGGDRFLGTPDLVDVGRRLVLEADSFAWHGSRVALRNDARRYNDFVAAGWIVLRFSWEDVMGDPELVRGVLEDLMRRPDAKCAHCAA